MQDGREAKEVQEGERESVKGEEEGDRALVKGEVGREEARAEPFSKDRGGKTFYLQGPFLSSRQTRRMERGMVREVPGVVDERGTRS